jgi:hypothetical protein
MNGRDGSEADMCGARSDFREGPETDIDGLCIKSIRKERLVPESHFAILFRLVSNATRAEYNIAAWRHNTLADHTTFTRIRVVVPIPVMVSVIRPDAGPGLLPIPDNLNHFTLAHGRKSAPIVAWLNSLAGPFNGPLRRPSNCPTRQYLSQNRVGLAGSSETRKYTLDWELYLENPS